MQKPLLLLVAICGSLFLNACGTSTPPLHPLQVATHLSVTSPSVAPVAGTPFNISVSALDATNNVVSTYSGTVHFTSTDKQAALPADSSLGGGMGTFPVTFKTSGPQSVMVADAAGVLTAGSSGSITVNTALGIDTTPPPAGVLDSPYQFTFRTTGTGLAPFVWSATTPLPPGLTLTATGLLSGQPTMVGTSSSTVSVSDQSVPPQTPSQSFSIQIKNPPPLAITTLPPLPNGTAGLSYGALIQASGGAPPYTFALATGSSPLPAGLSIITPGGFGVNNHGQFSGIPTVSGTFNNVILQVSDSQTPPATATMTYNITIAPPLPLTITSPILNPRAGVGIFYNSYIPTTGGVGPYTFTLGSGSSPLPAGLSLSAFAGGGILSGIPTATGTTNNIIFDVADSYTPPATTTGTYSLTIYPSTFYTGTQAPGDVWQLGVSHSSATDGVLGFQDQGTKGLTGPLGGTGAVSIFANPSGFLGDFNAGGTAVELPGHMVLFAPGVSGGAVVAAVANTCPQLAATTNYQFVALADEDFDLTKDAYGDVAVTQTAANTYNFASNAFTLAGGTGTASALPGLSCDSNLKVFSSTSAAGVTSTIALSASGLMVIDSGTGIPSMGVQRPAAKLSSTAILAGQYLGTVFYANDFTTHCPYPPGRCRPTPRPATDLVGFGPGSATSISGGLYSILSSDPFSAHGTNYTITLGTQTSPGLFTGGALMIGAKTLPDFDAVVGQVNGKFVLFGVTLDTTASPIQPYAVLLLQQ